MWRQGVAPRQNLDGFKRARLLLLEPLHDVELPCQLGGIDSLAIKVGYGSWPRFGGFPSKGVLKADSDRVYWWWLGFQGQRIKSGSEREEMQS